MPHRQQQAIERRAGGDVALPEIARYMILSLAVCGLAANSRDCDMPHRRVGLGAMPMAFTGLDVHDITYLDLMLLVLGRHHAGTRGHDQDLIAGVRMPPGSAASAEVHHAAVIVRRVAGLDNGLTRAGNRSRPPFDPLGAFHWDVRYVFKRDHLHDDPPSCRGAQGSRNPPAT